MPTCKCHICAGEKCAVCGEPFTDSLKGYDDGEAFRCLDCLGIPDWFLSMVDDLFEKNDKLAATCKRLRKQLREARRNA